MAVSLRVDKVTKRFGRHVVIDRVSLDIAPGELFFLLGPSGCGKSTLLRCIAGFHRPDEGTVHIGDADVTKQPPEARDTGMVFQSYALWPHLTVAENVAFGLEQRQVPKREAAARVAEALAQVHMADRAAARPNELSGGQQQRVALARALVVRPRCLLLDEPLSNLDAKLRLEMRTEIRRICKQAGLTAVYVTHDQKEALSIADRLAILDQGVIQQLGRPQDVYRRPVSRFVAGFIGESNFLPATVRAIAAGRIELDAGIGTIISAGEAAGPVAPGDRVTISLRPEAIHVGAAPADIANAFTADLRESVYLGEMAQHTVAAGGALLKIFDLNPKVFAREGEAERVPVWFRPEHVVVLRE